MSKGPSFLFEIERSSRQRAVAIERVHCHYGVFFIFGRFRCFRSFQVAFRSIQVVLNRFRLFQLVLHFSKYRQRRNCEGAVNTFCEFYRVFYFEINKNNRVQKPCYQIPAIGKLKSATKNATGITLRLLVDIIGTDKKKFPHNLLLTNRQA